ncbi:cytochrome b [Pseudomonas sp. SA3-5]|uniref:Cytochrome b n=1 Tax=Pseudomonas aestuarii TaxID=3018340 RepID=A0ABT4XCZ7_9PSED|nr:cytochrome b [Pseudomonas aestuarii]MDA7086084.1 cytochrome b [Pseudomonas aestuarii]
MTWKNTESRYGKLSIGLHWLMLLLIATVYFTMEYRGLFPKGSDGRALMKQLHFMLGLSILTLVWLRILTRLIAPTPLIQPVPHRVQTKLAKLMYLALYLLMICTPLLGWLILSAEAKPIPFFGLELPALLSKDHALAKQFEHWHVWIAQAGYWLIGLHAAAGLFHHYVRGDNALRMMLPSRK